MNAALDMNIQGMNDLQEKPVNSYLENTERQQHKAFPVLWNPHTFNGIPQFQTKIVIREVYYIWTFAFSYPQTL